MPKMHFDLDWISKTIGLRYHRMRANNLLEVRTCEHWDVSYISNLQLAIPFTSQRDLAPSRVDDIIHDIGRYKTQAYKGRVVGIKA